MSKMKSLIKNENLGQKRKFLSKIEILVYRGIFSQTRHFSQKMEILVKNGELCLKYKISSKMERILVTEISRQKSYQELNFVNCDRRRFDQNFSRKSKV